MRSSSGQSSGKDEAVAMIDDREALAGFVVENDDLERLEAQLAEFNLFEAIGAVRQELRHSDFLGFLLNPGGNHGLGDRFLKRFLERVLYGAPLQPVSPVEIDVSDLQDAEVRREWRGIDVLVSSEEANLACVIENKVDAGESEGQLAGYRETAETEFPASRLLFVFLTPDGREPSDSTYIPVAYADVAEIVDAIRGMYGSTLGTDVVTIMKHYTTMLRRHIVADSEVADLCRRIYRKHKQALDLIFEHRPDELWDIAEELKILIAGSSAEGIRPEHSTKSYVRFSHESWRSVPALMTGGVWSGIETVLSFEWNNSQNGLWLKLIIGPGPSSVREAIYEVAMRNPAVCVGATKPIYPKWTTIFRRKILNKKDLESEDNDARIEKVREAWGRFKLKDLPALLEIIENVEYPELQGDLTTG